MRSATFRDEHGLLNGKRNDIFVGNAFMHSAGYCFRIGGLNGKAPKICFK